ncbi:addiction module toxin, HicA family [Thiohalocapsa halophila]|uniref:Addiction module toxin, HicA family n=1 Tax=Thiohalocapsa halophila TaxID=69359 RepID=A0ABS1CRF1_9GAMM|nr:type II toxin-antitoxin system HicA family toxin [Thiohalocapsa halophila]MBK1633926.1 addiction module toxin, HicA family [Thiohalocapsa halophila]
MNDEGRIPRKLNYLVAGCYLKRHGSRHDIYANPATGKQAPVPRHPEIRESLCRLIRRQLEVPQQ